MLARIALTITCSLTLGSVFCSASQLATEQTAATEQILLLQQDEPSKIAEGNEQDDLERALGEISDDELDALDDNEPLSMSEKASLAYTAMRIKTSQAMHAMKAHFIKYRIPYTVGAISVLALAALIYMSRAKDGGACSDRSHRHSCKGHCHHHDHGHAH